MTEINKLEFCKREIRNYEENNLLIYAIIISCMYYGV